MAANEQSQTDSHRFYVHCLSTKKTLKEKRYHTVEEIKQDAFALYEQAEFNDHNAIVIYRDINHQEVLLTTVPDTLSKGQYRDLFIKFIHPVCAMCSSSFGILDNQLLLECPTVECGEQYCQKCVQSIQGVSTQYPLTCISCRKDVQPKRNLLIEKYFIWRNMSQLYGTENLLEFQKTTGFLSCQPILKDMTFRHIHLQSRLNTLQSNLPEQPAADSKNEKLIIDTEEFCRKIQNIANQVKDIHITMENHDIDLHNISERHKKIIEDFDNLGDRLIFFIEQLQMSEKNINMSTYDQDKKDIYESYRMNKLLHLSTDQNVESIDQSLRDINSRKQWLTFNLDTITGLLSTETSPDADLGKFLDKGRKKLEKLSDLMDKLNCLRGNLRSIQRLTDRYISLLYDDRQLDIHGSRFIYLLEILRVETERQEVVRNFPNSVKLIDEWQNDYGTGNDFKPKVLDLCQTIEKDLHKLFANDESIYSVPYRIGVVGYTSVGKSALIIKLANLTQFSSMVNLERSTFGYLQFETNFMDKSSNSKTIAISLVDIAGAINNDTSKSVGNYLELIGNADCDLYMIVFDNAFDRQNQIWLDHIEKTLGRKYLLVRSKVDVLFHHFYQEETGERFQNKSSKQCHIRSALERTRQHASQMYHSQRRASQTFLTAAGENNDLKDISFGQFELDRLKKSLHRSALVDMRLARVSRLAILASRTAINTCFRRGYTVSKTKYRWIAAGASLIPFLDELPAFFGREKLRQAFGIHDRSSLRNTFQGTTNSLEEYLTEHQFTIPQDLLKSGHFRYLISKDTKSAVIIADKDQTQCVEPKSTNYDQNKHPFSDQQKSSTSRTGTNIARYGLIIGGTIGGVLDDGLRIAAPAASGVLRGLSIAGIVIGVVLTPVIAAWSFYSSGKRMNRHLHLLCDDLQVVLVYFIDQLCQKCCENKPLLTLSSSDEESLSSDDD